MAYKRNQVEQAISRVVEPMSSKPSSELRTRLKRLLDTDRALGRAEKSASLAFYSINAPGRGVEIWFSEYEAFALLTGLSLLRHGWPQAIAVAVLRQVRSELEIHHARVLKADNIGALFDQAAIMQRARPGDLGVSNTDPLFLVVGSEEGEHRYEQFSTSLCRGQAEVMRLILAPGAAGQAWTILELVTRMHALSVELAETKPRKRGRPSS